MEKEKKTNRKYVIIWVFIILILSVIFRFINIGSHNTEKISAKIEEYLYEKYGEGFVVDRIGLRSSRGQEFYQARIYPRSIIGTNKQWDDYYYASASVNKYSFGRLGGVGDSYPLVKLKLGIEDYLMPEAKKIFGNRVLIKIEAHYKKREPGNKYFWGYKVESFEKARELIAEDPENRMIELDFDMYIFDRIDNEAEKEMRRKQIFDFVQYLKKEGLYEYLEMGVIFMDERVLAPGYKDFRREVDRSTKVREKVDGEIVYIPPMELRKRMSEQLQKEIDEMSEEELLESMRKIRKSDLIDLTEYNSQYGTFIYSWGILEVKYRSALDRRDKSRDYSKLEHVRLGKGQNYMYIN